MKEIELVAVDVAGTLTDERRLLYPEVLYALQELERRGIPVSIATGNSLIVALKLSQYFGLTGPVIAENGAVIYDQKSGIKVVIGDPGIGRKALELVTQRLGLKPSFMNRYREVDFILEKDKGINADEIRRICEENGLEVRVSDSKFLIHVCDRRVNKGVGLKEACRLRKVNLSKVAAIGDSMIDLEMLKLSGFPIALANSPEALKRVAKIVTEKPDGLGVIEAIEKYILKVGGTQR